MFYPTSIRIQKSLLPSLIPSTKKKIKRARSMDPTITLAKAQSFMSTRKSKDSLTKGYNIGLNSWVMESTNTWSKPPTKHNTMRVPEKRHFSSTLFLSSLKNNEIMGGYRKIVTKTDRNVPTVAAPSKLWRISLS